MVGRAIGYPEVMSQPSEFTVESAQSAARADRLGEWVRAFLASDGSDNEELAEELVDTHSLWIGPVEIHLDRLRRLAGPPGQPTLERLDSDDLASVRAMDDSIDDGWTPPPFVATWKGDHLSLEDGNHRAEALRRAGVERWWCVVGLDEAT